MVGKGAPLPLRLMLRTVQPPCFWEEEVAHGRFLSRRGVDVEGLRELRGRVVVAQRQRLHDGLVDLAHPKSLLGLASEARLAGDDQSSHAAFRAVVLRRDVGASCPVVDPVRVFPEDVLHFLQLRVPRALSGQLGDLRPGRLGLAGEGFRGKSL